MTDISDRNRRATEKHYSEKYSAAIDCLPALAILLYPFLLDLFHFSVGKTRTPLSASATISSGLVLATALCVPAIGLVFAGRQRVPASLRRLAYACVVAPTVYVFLGVVQALVGSSLPDQLVWCVLWGAVAFLAWWKSDTPTSKLMAPSMGRWRVAHGISGAIVLIYVGFHVINHLFGLIGPGRHAEVMEFGRQVYRAPLIEPFLVAMMIFQVVSGLRLSWQWSSSHVDFYRVFQVASGFYLSIFIVGHMNSVFIYARTYLGIPTDWAFASGDPTGLIHDPWNIRLLPHYLLGVFFVLAHLVSGLRVVLLAHGFNRTFVDRMWLAGAGASAAIAITIIVALSGGRI